MPLIEKLSQLAIELEAVEGTAETLEGADVILASDPDFQPVIEPTERNPTRSVMSPMASAAPKRSATVGWMSHLIGTSAAGTTNHLADALKACGVSETLQASTSATYKPASSSVSAATLGKYTNGNTLKAWGARGSFTLVLEAGKPGVFNFNFQAADWSEADAALLTTGVTLPTLLPPVFQGATVTLDAFAVKVQRIELDAGNVLQARASANSSSGILSVLIADRRPTMTIAVERELVATKDFFTKLKAGTTVPLSAAFGSGAGSVMTLTAPAIQYQSVGVRNVNGIQTLEFKFLCCLNTGDDEWQLVVT